MKTFLLLLLCPLLAFGQKVEVVDSQGNKTQQTLSGDVSITTGGVATLASGLSKLSITGLNAKTTGAQTIGTTASSLNFHPLFLTVESTAVNTPLAAVILSVGTNSTSYNNVLAITTQTGVAAVGTFLMTNLATTANAVIAPSTVVKVNITTGSTATSQTISVTLFGYYQ